MPIILKNNVDSTLAQAISASETAAIVTAGDGAKFPALGAGDYFYATLMSAQGTREIVKVTSKSIDTLAITRAQEGTTANGFAVGSRVEMRVTAASITDLVDEHDQASEITIADAGNYYTSGTVEGALQEVGGTLRTQAAQERDTVAALLADTVFTYTASQPGTVAAGSVIQTRAEGFSYVVAASGVTNQHVTTAGGVKLYVQRNTGGYDVMAFGAIGNGTTDDAAAIRAAITAANNAAINATYTGSDSYVTGGPAVFFPRGVYRVNSTIDIGEARHVYLEGDGKVLILGDTSGNKTVTCFAGILTRYLTVKNIQFQNFDIVFACSTYNIDSSSWTFDKVQVETVNCFVDTFTYARSRSTVVSFNDCIFQYNVVRVARAFVDNMTLHNCWISSGSSSTSSFYVNSNISFYGCVFVPSATNSGNRCWVYLTNDNGDGGIDTDPHRGVLFSGCRISNEGGNGPAVVCDYPVYSNIYATPAIAFSGCAITGFQPVPFDAGNSESGIVYLKQYPAGISFSGCSFVSVGAPYAKIVAKVDSLSASANDIFSVDMDDLSFNNAMRNAGESSGYRIAGTLRGYIRNPDPFTFRGINEDGFLPVVSTATDGVKKAVFTVQTGYTQVDYRTPIQFILHLSGVGITGPNNDLGYAGASSYIVTLDGFFGGSPNAHYSRLRFTKLHGGAYGLFDGSNADIVSLHFGTGDTGDTTAARATSHSITCVFGAATVSGIARVVPLMTKRTRYIQQMSG